VSEADILFTGQAVFEVAKLAVKFEVPVAVTSKETFEVHVFIKS